MDVKRYAPHTGRYLDENNVAHNIIEHMTGAVKIIDNDHAYIHDGRLFTVPVFISALAASGTYKITFMTPLATAGYMHYRPSTISTSGDKVTVSLYEGSADAAGGSAATPINRNRVSTRVAGSVVTVGATVATNGTLIDRAYVGGGTGTGANRSGSETGVESEIILKANTLHTIEVVNGSSAANNIFLMLKWYEEESA